MLYDQRSPLSQYAYGLLASSRTGFAAADAEQAIGVGHGAFLDAAERLQRRKALVNIRKGFYVVVPPEFSSWGAPSPDYYIDDLMRHEGQPYYVGLLEAGAMHGATHQAVMEFQVVTCARLPSIIAGGTRIEFYYRKGLDDVASGIEERTTRAGRMLISSPALTALDLLRYRRGSGGIDHNATMLLELAERIDPLQLAELSTKVEKSVVQRLGYMMDRLELQALTTRMHEALRNRGAYSWVELLPWMARPENSVFGFEPLEKDTRWRVVARRIPEPDDV